MLSYRSIPCTGTDENSNDEPHHDITIRIYESEGTGKIRKIVTDSSAATETYLAHTLPDKAVSKATPIGLIILMAVFDWRLGIMCLIPAAIGFVFMSSMSGKDLAEV